LARPAVMTVEVKTVVLFEQPPTSLRSRFLRVTARWTTKIDLVWVCRTNTKVFETA
jgi:hypothetical protein